MGREATPYESKSQLFFPIVWLVATALLLVATQTIGAPQALGDASVDAPETSASDYLLVGADPSEHELPTVLYGGLLWSVVEVRVTPTEEFLGRSVIDVDLELTNSLAATRLRISERAVSMVTDDGLELPAGRFVDAGTRLTIDPGEAAAVTFRVTTGHSKNPDPEDLSLVISESNRVPASIPLAGDDPVHDPPVLLAVDDTSTPMEDPDDPDRQIVVTPIAGSLAINAGPYRAAVGERLALVKVEVQRAAASDASGFLDTGFWSMTADDEAVGPIAVTRTTQFDSNADEITLLFAFPADATAFALEAGVGSPESSSFPLVVPASN